MKRNFTLVELLVVTVIIGIIVGAVVPAFTRLMTGNAVSYGLRMTTSQLNMARVEACARRRFVAVVFPDSSFSGDIIGYRCAFRSCFVEKNTSGDYEFKEWVPSTKWEYLPKGAYFGEDTVLPLEVKDVTDEDGLLTSGTHNIRAVIFSASGRAANKTSFEVVVREGVVTDNATVTRHRQHELPGTGDPAGVG